MRYLILILILVVAGYLAYHQFLTPPSAEVKDVKQLEKEFNNAVMDFMRAVRTAGEIGIATVPDAQDAVRKIKKVKADLTDLMKKLKEEAAIKRSKKLMAKIAEFYQKNDLY